jgi:hypothetical protein
MIELPIFFYTDDQQEKVNLAKDLGLEEPDFEHFDNFAVKDVLFVGSFVVVPYKSDGKYKYTKIYTGEEYWICKLKYDEVKALIK